MSELAHFYQLLHSAVYDLTGWALPDEGLRRLAAQVPSPLHQAGDPMAWNQRVRQWCARHPETVEAVVQDLQAVA